jgi:predicted metal-dependent enzyme (double-stranded beta helix superfamily)
MDTTPDSRRRVEAVRTALANLVTKDDWLPDDFARPHPAYYQQYLLHCDPHERFSVVSFVWGPGQKTPIHNHTVWGLVGMLRGAEISRRYVMRNGSLHEAETSRLLPGQIETLIPEDGDIHQVENQYDDRVSVSIHVYGGNIGRLHRHTFDPRAGTSKDFVSGFSSAFLPNFWV